MADVAAQVVAPSSSPVVAVGETFIDLTPGWLKDFAVSAFGTNDKLVLLLSMGVVIAALAVAAGLAAAVPRPGTWRQWTWGWDARPGLQRLEVRSTDVTGDTKPGTRRPPKPDGATGWHSVTVTVA